MGLLGDLSQVQETYRGMLRSLYVGAEGISDLTEDNVIAVCVAHWQMTVDHSGDPYHEPTENDVMNAIEFIDNLDTLGKAVVMSK